MIEQYTLIQTKSTHLFKQMKKYILSRRRKIMVGVCLLPILSGCTILAPYDRDQIGIWDQNVYHEVEGTGMYGFTQFGPWYLGSFKSLWKRNIIECECVTPEPVPTEARPRRAGLSAPVAPVLK